MQLFLRRTAIVGSKLSFTSSCTREWKLIKMMHVEQQRWQRLSPRCNKDNHLLSLSLHNMWNQIFKAYEKGYGLLLLFRDVKTAAFFEKTHQPFIAISHHNNFFRCVWTFLLIFNATKLQKSWKMSHLCCDLNRPHCHHQTREVESCSPQAAALLSVKSACGSLQCSAMQTLNDFFSVSF